MKKLMLTLAVLALSSNWLLAQDVTPVNGGTIEEPDRVEMRMMSKDPTGADVITSNQVKDETPKCTKAEGHKCAKAEGKTCEKAAAAKECAKGEGHKCAKAEGKTCEKAAAAKECAKGEGHKCTKGEGKECHKAGEACTKPADEKCDECKKAEIEAKTIETPQGPKCRVLPNNGKGKEASIEEAKEAKEDLQPMPELKKKP